jgi:hypothetical protein
MVVDLLPLISRKNHQVPIEALSYERTLTQQFAVPRWDCEAALFIERVLVLTQEHQF